MVVVVKEAIMGWTSRLRASGEVKPVDPWDETVINSAPNGAHRAVRGNAENPAAPGDPPGAQIAEEIKRRQTSLAVRYVAAVRARSLSRGVIVDRQDRRNRFVHQRTDGAACVCLNRFHALTIFGERGQPKGVQNVYWRRFTFVTYCSVSGIAMMHCPNE